MKGLVIFALIFGLGAFGSAQAQNGSPAAPGSIGGSFSGPAGANPSTNQTDPALRLQGMPCSVSLNATGGVTTSSSCGTDPLAVPTQTLAPPPQAGGSGRPSPQASAGGSTTGSSSAAAAGGGGTLSGGTTLCSSGIPSTSGPAGAASLAGGGC